MCLIAFAWKAHPDYPLIVAANRDEWRARPAAAAHWWEDAPEILAGRDLQAGGTWLGVSRSGRFAALTNFRDPSDKKPEAPSRGELVARFLESETEPRAFLQELRRDAARYAGFNLLVGARDALWFFSQREDEILPVPPGVHALSNHTLNEPWPKVEMAKSALGEALEGKMAWKARQSLCFAFLSNEKQAPDESLPDTGVGREWERRLSSALIVGQDYGTRASTVLGFAADGRVDFVERTLEANGATRAVAAYAFSVRRRA
jgi:uncharacterized protein with NRDE domain